MLQLISVFFAISSFVCLHAAAFEPRASTKCYTTHTGYFEAGAQEFGLNAYNQVIYPADDTKFKLSLQVCALNRIVVNTAYTR